MNIFKYKKSILIIGSSIVIAAFFIFLLPNNIIQAGQSDAIRGWAWNDGTGWISFNCVNDDSCASIDYGVDIDAVPVQGKYNLTGWAWSSNVGWIWFDPPAPYPDFPPLSAYLDENETDLDGWARICNLANDVPNCQYGSQGWIKLGGLPTYGVYLDNYPDYGQFFDYAWNDDYGYISFNCLNADECATSYYQVTHLDSPNIPRTNDFTDIQLCTNASSYIRGCCEGGVSGMPTLDWTVAVNNDSYCDCDAAPVLEDCCCGGGCPGSCTPCTQGQVSYWVEIDNNNDFSSPEYRTGEVVSTDTEFTPPAGSLPSDTYYWRVGIRDAQDSITSWIEESTSFTLPLDCSYVAGTPPADPTVTVWGSDSQICTVEPVVQDPGGCYAGDSPNPTFNWTYNQDVVGNIIVGADDLGDPAGFPQESYWLQVATDAGFTTIVYDTGEVASNAVSHQICTDALNFNTTYYWRVAAKDTNGSWTYNNPPGHPFAVAASSFTTQNQCAPTAPTIDQVNTIDCNTFEISWTDNSDNETGFQVESDLDPVSWPGNLECNTSFNVTSCFADPMNPNSLYWFRVGATNAWGTSWSGNLSGSTEKFCQPVLSYDDLGVDCNCIELSWTITGDTNEIDNYEVWRRIDSGLGYRPPEIATSTLDNTVTNYDDCDIVGGMENIEYWIIAVDNDDIDQESNHVQVPDVCAALPVWREIK